MESITHLLAHRGLSLDRLHALIQVADAGGIAAAAPSSPTKQSQMSRQISELQAFFEVPLTHKRGRKLMLTDAGLRLVEEARTFFCAIGALRDESKQEGPVTVSLGAGDTLLQYQVVPAAAAVRRAVPRASLSLLALPNEAIDSFVRDGRLDAGVLRAERPPKRIDGVRVGTWDCALFVPSALASGCKRVEDVLRRAPIALQASEVGFVSRVLEAATRRGITPNIALRCETFSQALQAVRSGAFAAILPTVMSRELPSSKVRVFRGAAIGDHAAPLWLVHQPRIARLKPAMSAVLAALEKAIAPTK